MIERGRAAAGFFQESIDPVVPMWKIRWREGMIGRSGKDEVCDLEGADGSVLGGGEGVELLGDTEGSFADFAGGADVAYYGGVDIGVVNYRTVVANSGREGLVLDSYKRAWNDDVGVCGGDEE